MHISKGAAVSRASESSDTATPPTGGAYSSHLRATLVGLCALAVLFTSAKKSQPGIVPPGANASTDMQLLHVHQVHGAAQSARVAQWIVHESRNAAGFF